MSKMEPHNLHNIKRNFEKKTGTRLLPYADSMDHSEPRRKSHPKMAVVSVLLCVVILVSGLLIAFPYLRSAWGESNSADSISSLSESQVPSGSEENENAEESKPTEILSIEEYNLQLVHQCNESVVSESFMATDKLKFEIHARVSTGNVDRVSLYEYIPMAISDTQRINLLQVYFQERVNEVYHNTVGYSNSWVLMNESEYYHFGYNRSPQYIDESGFFLINQKVGLVDLTDGMRESLDDVGFPLSDAYSQCNVLIEAVVGNTKYMPSIIRPISTARPTVKGAYWIVYRRELDGVPVIANWDLKFFVTQNEVVKMVGTLYEVQELSLEQQIISMDDALASLEKHASLIDYDFLEISYFFEETIPVSKITFEYLVLPGSDGRYIVTPIWRFQLGETEDQRNILRDKVIAVNALTGELIAQYRGV